MNEVINRTGKNYFKSEQQHVLAKFFPIEFVVDAIDTHAAFEAAGLTLDDTNQDNHMHEEEQ
jgi:hypothetical protein